MPELETQIWMALKQSVVAAAGIAPIAWPTDTLPFVPPTTAGMLLPFIAVGDTQSSIRALISSTATPETTGILSLAYVAPLGYTHEWYIQRASALKSSFPIDGLSRFQSACVQWGNGLAVPRVERGYRDSGYYRTPVIIPWRLAA